MNVEELKVIADLTKDLVAMRQSKCGHLCIENIASEIFSKLLNAYLLAGKVVVEQDLTGFTQPSWQSS